MFFGHFCGVVIFETVTNTIVYVFFVFSFYTYTKKIG